MTTRERTLATVLLVIVVAVGGLLVAKGAFLDLMGNLDKKFADVDNQIDQRLAEIKAEESYVAAVEKLSPRLGKWEKLSLPEIDVDPKHPERARDKEAIKTHETWVRD